MSQLFKEYAKKALAHATYLAKEIGPRPTTQEGERQAVSYCEQALNDAKLSQVRTERFSCGPSTYRPYTAAFFVGFVGTVLLALWPHDVKLAWLAFVLNALGAWGFWREAAGEKRLGWRVWSMS